MFRQVAFARINSSSQYFLRSFSTASEKFDVVVIGGGPGGYVAAIKAGQLGMKVACVEKRETLGGTCLNVGCIPSKALLNTSHHFAMANHDFSKMGIEVSGVKLNLDNMMKQKEKAVKGLTQGIAGLFKKNKVTHMKGFGKIVSANEVEIDLNGGGTQRIKTDNIVIATGSEPTTLPNIKIDENRIVSSTGALELKQVPKKMIVVGAGVIGLEMGSVWSRLGADVTVIEYLDRITPSLDLELANKFQQILTKQKLKFKMSTKVLGAKSTENNVTLTVTASKGGSAEEQLEADVVLVSTGRRPYLAGLGLEKLGVQMKGPFVQVDEHWRTNVPSIYAIGDAAPGPMLAHKAEEEGIAVIEHIKKGHGHVNYGAIPNVIYTHPEVATVGLTEEEVKQKNIQYRIGKFPMMANSRARTVDDAEGLMKVIVEKDTDRLLGVHMIAANAGELISEAVLGLEYGASAEDLARTCHAHPTLSEALKEACMDAYEKPIHF